MALALKAASSDSLRRREMYFFALFRCLEAALLALWVFSPYGPIGERGAGSLLQAMGAAYLIGSALLLLLNRMGPNPNHVLSGLLLDLAVFAGLAWLLPAGFYSVSLIMLVNLAAGGVLLGRRASAAITAAAMLVVLGHYLGARLQGEAGADLVQALMFAACYAATVAFCQMLAAQARLSQDLADERGQHLAEMAQMNELIIKRMRTGVILLDKHHRLVLHNEAAGQLSQKALERGSALRALLPELDRRLIAWRRQPDQKPEALSLYLGGPVVIPRFVGIPLHDLHYLVFLEDSRVFSGRADELQLANLGRLSASIAHEIRNPLAAISYAQQLMADSPELSEGDRKLLDIIGKQTQRLNGIIENILSLARRETASPQGIELNDFAQSFLDEHLSTHPQDRANIRLAPHATALHGLFDRSHLHQVLTVLLTNALHYGRLPHEAPQVTLGVRMDGKQPCLEVSDRGPGIPEPVREHLFSPFHTTSEHGTGLGLYIAKQLSEANQAQLRYEPVLGGGSRFVLRLAGGRDLLGKPA